MKKIVVVMLMSIMLTWSKDSSSGGETKNTNVEQEGMSMFERHDLDRFYSVLVDKETRVCYLECKCSGGYYGIVVMVNPDGTPKIWEE